MSRPRAGTTSRHPAQLRRAVNHRFLGGDRGHWCESRPGFWQAQDAGNEVFGKSVGLPPRPVPAGFPVQRSKPLADLTQLIRTSK